MRTSFGTPGDLCKPPLAQSSHRAKLLRWHGWTRGRAEKSPSQAGPPGANPYRHQDASAPRPYYNRSRWFSNSVSRGRWSRLKARRITRLLMGMVEHASSQVNTACGRFRAVGREIVYAATTIAGQRACYGATARPRSSRPMRRPAGLETPRRTLRPRLWRRPQPDGRAQEHGGKRHAEPVATGFRPCGCLARPAARAASSASGATAVISTGPEPRPGTAGATRLAASAGFSRVSPGNHGFSPCRPACARVAPPPVTAHWPAIPARAGPRWPTTVRR